jgi:hypothetical protein
LLLSLQLLVVSSLFGAIALGTLKAIIRLRISSLLTILSCDLARLLSTRGLPQLSADLLDQ